MNLVVWKTLVHLSAAAPLVWLYWGAYFDTIGADPVERVIHFTGIGALHLLLITLTLSPLAKRLKKPVLIKFRRLLGLWAFTYSLIHLINFIAFELQFNWSLVFGEIIERPYITVGFTALLILTSLAITSVDKIKRQMGINWQRLHNWGYVATVLVVIHFYWSVKSDIYEPGLYAAITLFLLAQRWQRIKSWLGLK
ncbi:protein-methionine-sulfoxide reductase heme-binding subunit MsrQ [Colwellia sp. MEBiC06753]